MSTWKGSKSIYKTMYKASVDIGKNMGYGAANSDRVARNFLNIARGSENLNVTFKSLVDAMNELSTSTGFVTEYSKDALSTQVMLTKQLGLTGDEAAGFYKFSNKQNSNYG